MKEGTSTTIGGAIDEVQQIVELDELHLARVGGGTGEVVWS